MTLKMGMHLKIKLFTSKGQNRAGDGCDPRQKNTRK